MAYQNKGSSKSKETKKLIEQIAAKLFALKGWHNVTLEEVAREVGVTGVTVHNYFGNRERLFLNLALLFWASLNKRLDKELSAAGHDLAGQIRAFLETAGRFLEENGHFFAVVGFQARSFTVVEDVDDETGKVWQALQKEISYFQTAATLIIGRGRDKKIFRTDCSADVFWSLFWGALCGFVEEFVRRHNRRDSLTAGDFQSAKKVLMGMLLESGIKEAA